MDKFQNYPSRMQGDDFPVQGSFEWLILIDPFSFRFSIFYSLMVTVHVGFIMLYFPSKLNDTSISNWREIGKNATTTLEFYYTL